MSQNVTYFAYFFSLGEGPLMNIGFDFDQMSQNVTKCHIFSHIFLLECAF